MKKSLLPESLQVLNRLLTTLEYLDANFRLSAVGSYCNELS